MNQRSSRPRAFASQKRYTCIGRLYRRPKMNFGGCGLLASIGFGTLLWLSSVNCYKVLIIAPGLSNSQLVFNYRVASLLVSRGHDVTVFKIVYNDEANRPAPNGITQIEFQAIENLEQFKAFQKGFQGQIFKQASNLGNMTGFFQFFETFVAACDRVANPNNAILKQLKEKKFDIAFAHFYDVCSLGLIKVLEIPSYIWMSSGVLIDYMANLVGAPTIPSYVPNVMSSFSDSMTFFERLQNFGGHLIFLPMASYFLINPETKIFKKYYGDNFPDLADLCRDAPLVFINSEELLDFPRPILHKIVYVGGIGMQQAPGQLSQDWEQALSGGKKGAVVFSLGSVLHTSEVPAEIRKSFFNAFKRFPDYQFIVKWDDGFAPEAAGAKNIITRKWIPQNDLLGSPKVKLFITHGGYNSLLESANAGVPMIMMPVFGDQMGNLKRAIRHEIGVGLSKFEVTEETVYARIQQVLGNQSYYQNAQRLSRMIKKKPINADDLAVKWTEFMAEFKTLPNLQPVGASLPSIEYYSIDIVGSVIAGALVVLFLIYKIIGYYCWSCCRLNNIDLKQKQKRN